MRKLIHSLDRITDTCLLIFFILVFLVGLYFCSDIYYVYAHAVDDTLLEFKPQVGVHTRPLAQLSSDAIGWITIEGTDIDYPVMQGEDNAKYLNMDPYGEFSLSGSIFLDARNSAAFTDDYSLIYGHHMEYGKMFGALDSFLEGDYFETHQKGTLMSEEGNYELEIFAVVPTDDTVDLIFNPTGADRAALMEYIQENAVQYTSPIEGHLLGLSTCADTSTSARLVVFAIIR